MSKPLSTNARRKVNALVAQMHQAFQQQNWELCEQSCLQIESWEPNNPESANVRGIVAVQMGDAKAAEHYFVRAVNAAPKREDFMLNLARLYYRQGQPLDALPMFEKVLEMNPASLVAILGAGQCLFQIHELQRARKVFCDGRVAHPDSDDLDMGLFQVYLQLGDLEQAEAVVKALLERNPSHVSAWLAYAKVTLQQGSLSKAEEYARRAFELNPNDVDTTSFLANLRKYSEEDKDFVDTLVKQYDSLDKRSPLSAILGFSLGKLLGDLGEYDQSFEYIHAANDLRHQHSQYNLEAELGHLEAIVQQYALDSTATTSQSDEDAPIFIVGMPRCGSTLVEQILAAHPQVEGMGESDFFEKSIGEMIREDRPMTIESMLQLSSDEWGELNQIYMNMARESYPEGRRLTDKTLVNIRMVGAIYQAFPKAKIIHVRRNPVDTCWSIYKNHFASTVFDFEFNLEALGKYYRAYERLMEHWRNVLPSGVMYECEYENLVQHQEIETLKLLDACNLESDDACFQFHKSKHVAVTSSYAQVRKAMYTTSMGAARHYEKHLQPLIQILEQ